MDNEWSQQRKEDFHKAEIITGFRLCFRYEGPGIKMKSSMEKLYFGKRFNE